MKNLQEATERICELKGSLIALDALLPALLDTLTPAVREAMLRSFDAHAEAARTVMLHTDISDHVLASFERDVARTRTMLPGATRAQRRPDPCATASAAVLLTTTRIGTFVGPRLLSRASGFFFRRDGCLFLVMSRHVVADESSSHYPDRIEIDVHTDAQDLTQHAIVSIPLCRDGLRLWRQNADDAEPVDVAVIAIESDRLPEQAVLHAFDATHLESDGDGVAIGDAVSVIGFPFGFDDTVHHLAVAHGAAVASAHGVRFRQHACFLTEGRAHPGSSGGPVLRRRGERRGDGSLLPWQLLGVHSIRGGVHGCGQTEDPLPGFACVWYADVLSSLTGSHR